MANIAKPEPAKISAGRSTERNGVGQSGYTAGRARDAALQRDIATEPVPPRGDADEDESVRADLATDDRWH